MSHARDELSRTLALCKEPSGQTITIEFEDNSKQVIRPSKAFANDVRGLCEHIAAGRKYKHVSA